MKTPIILLLITITFSGYSQMQTVEDFGNPNLITTWQTMLDQVGYIRATKGATYNLTPTTSVAQIQFIKSQNDFTGFEADGQGCTIILPLDQNNCKYLFSVDAHNTYIHDFNVVSTVSSAPMPCSSTGIKGNNWYGIHSQNNNWTLSGLKVHNMSFNGLAYGIRCKYQKEVDLAHIQMDYVLTGFSVSSSSNVRITDFYIDKRDLGSKKEHGIYSSDCSDLIISDGIFKGAAEGDPEDPTNHGWSRAINLKITGGFTTRQSGAQVSNIQMEGTGGIALWGHDGAVFTNISFSHTLGNQLVWCNDGATATFNGMAAEFDAPYAASVFEFSDGPSNITVDGFKFNGPTWITAGNSKLTFSNGTFTNPLGQVDLPKHYVINTHADDAEAVLRFDNVDFIQTIPHTSLYFGRAGRGRNEFINCNIDVSDYPLDYFMNVSTALDAVHVDNNTSISGMNLMRISSHDGYLYWNDNVSKSAFYSEHGERIINQTSGNTIEISSRTIGEYGHELEIFNSSGTGNVLVTTEGSETINGETEWLVKNNAKFRMNGTNVDVITDGGGIWKATNYGADGVTGDGFFSINGKVQNNVQLSLNASNSEALRIYNNLSMLTYSFAHLADNTPALSMYNTAGVLKNSFKTVGSSYMQGSLGLGGITSNGANLHLYKDMRIGSSADPAAIRSTSGTNLTTADPTGKDLTFYNYHATETANQWQWNFTGSSLTPTSGDHRGLHVYRTFKPTSGTASYDFMRISPTINQTGGASGATVGLKIDPTITNAHAFNALETTAGNVVHAGNLASTTTSTTLAAAAPTLEISSNVVKVTGDSGGNTLTTITGGISGQVLTLIFLDALVTISDDDNNGANAINLSGNSTNFGSTDDATLTLVYDGTSWRETFRSVN